MDLLNTGRNPRPSIAMVMVLLALLAVSWAAPALAHGISGTDAGFVAQAEGLHLLPYFYLGAKHMVTGYDHLLFLLGVIFFLYGLRHVALYVTLFSIGHSLTLLAGVFFSLHVNSYIVDAIIGLSVVYKAFDNLGGFRTVFNFEPNTRVAVLLFGLVHGFGLATKLQALSPSRDGLLGNLIAFNLGVETGQILALAAILILMDWWRRTQSFTRGAMAANVAIMAAGFMLIAYQLAGYFTTQGA